MKLIFLGTRGNTEARTEQHHRHSSLMISQNGHQAMIDCGDDWSGEVSRLGPEAIVLTHAHADHAGGLKDGAPAAVYATEESWGIMESFHIEDREVIAPRRLIEICGVCFEAFPLDHSTRAPAVGYRITAGGVTAFYAPDVVWIHDRKEALRGAKLYVGDGATVARSMVRRSGEALIGHTPIRTQLTWCQKEGVPQAIFTHCGTEIVEGDERALAAKVQEMARERGVEAEIAHDGMELVLG